MKRPPRARGPVAMSLSEKAKLMAMLLGALVCLAFIVLPNPLGLPDESGPTTADLTLEGDVWHQPVELTLVDRAAAADTLYIAQTLAQVQDLTETLHPGPYSLLLQMAARTPPESLQARPYVDPYPQFVSDPASLRGKLVRVRGRLAAMRGDLAPKEVQELCGVQRIYSGWLLDAAGHGIQFKVVEKRQDFVYGMENGDPVQVVGYFYKNWLYERENDELARMPLIVGYTVEDLPPPVDSGFVQKLWIIGLGVLAVFFVTMSWVFIKSRGSDRRADEQAAARRKARMQKMLQRKSADSAQSASATEPPVTGEPTAAPEAAETAAPEVAAPDAAAAPSEGAAPEERAADAAAAPSDEPGRGPAPA